MTSRTPGGPHADRRSRVATREEFEALGRRILSLVSAPAAQVSLGSNCVQYSEYARGDTHVANDGGNLSVSLQVDFGDKRAYAGTTQIDDAGLKMLVEQVEDAARQQRAPSSEEALLGPQQYRDSLPRYFESIGEAMRGVVRETLCRRILDRTDAAGVIGTGQVSLVLQSQALMNTRGLFAYDWMSSGGLSLTARTRDGTGSGWAGDWSANWPRLDTSAVIERAIDIAQRSAHPVAIEPGRYTVILEPQAVAAFLVQIGAQLNAAPADAGYTVFSKDPRGTNKIGLQMMDSRLGLVADPWDPERPSMVWDSMTGHPLTRKVWFEKGVLKDLRYDAAYARQKGREPVYTTPTMRLTADGPTQTLEEMIASTKRGIWVNRFDDSGGMMNARTLLLSGTTRDGTFLIENGKITKAIKNLRYTESPFFIFNKVEAFGVPVRTRVGMVAPRLKVRDFDFTSLTDAV